MIVATRQEDIVLTAECFYEGSPERLKVTIKRVGPAGVLLRGLASLFVVPVWAE